MKNAIGEARGSTLKTRGSAEMRHGEATGKQGEGTENCQGEAGGGRGKTLYKYRFAAPRYAPLGRGLRGLLGDVF